MFLQALFMTNLGATLDGAQGLLLVLHSGISPGELGDHIGSLQMDPGSAMAMCKAALPPPNILKITTHIL